jgi:hypothetical protein
MRNLPWTPRARMIGLFLQAIGTIGIMWLLFVGTWFALGGH